MKDILTTQDCLDTSEVDIHDLYYIFGHFLLDDNVVSIISPAERIDNFPFLNGESPQCPFSKHFAAECSVCLALTQLWLIAILNSLVTWRWCRIQNQSQIQYKALSFGCSFMVVLDWTHSGSTSGICFALANIVDIYSQEPSLFFHLELNLIVIFLW